jgi:nicotinate-nucleotide pyrophosphorylase (carboxylating)
VRLRNCLPAERVALNFLQRLSGIATLTRRFVDAREALRRESLIRARRRRVCECSRSMRSPRGRPECRLGLDDGILIKDNHLALGGASQSRSPRSRQAPAIFTRSSRSQTWKRFVRRLPPMPTCCFSTTCPAQVRQAVEVVKATRVRPPDSDRGQAMINIENVREYAEAGVDLI